MSYENLYIRISHVFKDDSKTRMEERLCIEALYDSITEVRVEKYKKEEVELCKEIIKRIESIISK